VETFNFVYHNFDGYHFGVDLDCPIEFTITRCSVQAKNLQDAKKKALTAMVTKGHMTAVTAEKYLKIRRGESMNQNEKALTKVYCNTFSDIAERLTEGKTVFWRNTGYQVVKSDNDYYIVHHKGDTVGLHCPDYNPGDFFSMEPPLLAPEC